MSAIVAVVNNQIRNMRSFINISCSYFKRRNPIMASFSNMIKTLHTFIASGKRLKILRYQVQLMHYRMHQMEKLMRDNNPNNFLGGKSLNKYR